MAWRIVSGEVLKMRAWKISRFLGWTLYQSLELDMDSQIIELGNWIVVFCLLVLWIGQISRFSRAMPLMTLFCAENFGLSFDVFVDTSIAEKFWVLGHRQDSDFLGPLQFQCIGQSNERHSSKERSKPYVLIFETTDSCWKSFESLDMRDVRVFLWSSK